MNWYKDEEYDNYAPRAFDSDYSPYDNDNDRDGEPNNTTSLSKGILCLAFGLGDFIANNCDSSYD